MEDDHEETSKTLSRASQSMISDIQASSLLTDTKSTHYARFAIDDDLTTCYAEGEEGMIGAKLHVTFKETCSMSGLKIYGGYGKSTSLYHLISR